MTVATHTWIYYLSLQYVLSLLYFNSITQDCKPIRRQAKSLLCSDWLTELWRVDAKGKHRIMIIIIIIMTYCI